MGPVGMDAAKGPPPGMATKILPRGPRVPCDMERCRHAAANDISGISIEFNCFYDRTYWQSMDEKV
ncbi:MAG: hypothetical protein D4R77_03935 [Planctomycetaceae bacterium]|nr:MAG: hypothetical protein D4R77_03935 [Planctomycetaceae bacterium]